MKLSDALQNFRAYLEDLGRSSSTITAYFKDIEQLTTYLTKEENVEDISKVDTEHLKNYIENLKSDKKRGYTLKTVSRKINSMKTFFKYLKGNDQINENPALAVKHPKYKSSAPRILTKLEYSALRDVARSNSRLYTIVELLLQTGIRIGELARLKIDSIKLDGKNRTIQIDEYGSNPSREVTLNQFAEDTLKSYLKIRPEPREGVNALFITKNGNPLLVRNIRTSITRALEKIGIKGATVNDIRNTFIVHQLVNGMPLELLGNIVGHKRLTSTKRYLPLIEDKSKRKSTKIVPL